MSFTVAELRAIFTADDRAFQAAVGRMSAGQQRVHTIGMGLAKGLTLPIVAAGFAASKLAVDFQGSMLRIHTQAGASTKDVKTLSAAVLGLGGKVQQGPKELAGALYHLKSVGLDNAQAMKALKQASDFAAVGHANLEETTNALAGAWRSGIKGAHNFKQAVSTLNAIIGAGNMSMDDLTGAMSTGFLPAAKTFGLSLKDVGAALALMTDEGIPAQVAATRLRMSFSLLGAPSKAAEKYLKTIGLTGLEMATTMRKPNGLLKTVQLLHDHLQGLSKPQQAQLLSRAFGGGQSSSAIMTLLNNLDVFRQKEQQVEKTANQARFGDAVAKQADTAQAKLGRFKSAVETAGVKVGNVLLPQLTSLANGLGDAATAFGNMPASQQTFIVKTAALAAVLGPAILLLSGLTRGMMNLAAIAKTSGTWLATQAVGLKNWSVAMASAETRSTALGLAAMKMGSLARGAAGIGGVALLAKSFTDASKKSSVLEAAAGGLLSGAALGAFAGPVGAAIGAGIGGVSGLLVGLADHASHAATSAGELKKKWAGVKDTLDGTTGALTESTRAFVLNQMETDGTLAGLKALGIDTRTAIDAMMGTPKAAAAVNTALAKMTANYGVLQTKIAALKADRAKLGQGDGISSADEQKSVAISKQIAKLEDQAKAQKAVIDSLNTGIGTIRQDAKQRREDTAAVIDWNKRLRQAVDTAYKVPKRVVTEIEQHGAPQTQRQIASIAKAYKLTPKQIQTLIQATGVDTTVGNVRRVEARLKAVGAMHPKPKVSVDTAGASSQITRLQHQIDSLTGKTVTITTVHQAIQYSLNQKRAGINAATAGPRRHKAGGGPVNGPGGPTSDSILAMLSDGEFVMPAAAVRKYGLGFMERIQQRRYALGGLVGRYAGGGAVRGYAQILAAGIRGNNGIDTSALGGVAGSWLDHLADQINSALEHKKLGKKAAAQMTAVVEAVRRGMAVAAKAYADGLDNLTQLQQQRQDMITQIAGGLSGELDLSAGLVHGYDKSGNPIAVATGSAGGAVSALAARLKAFSDKIKKMLAMGIPKGLVQEVAGLGSVDGAAVADQLLASNAQQLKTLQTDYASIQSYATGIGTTLGDAFYAQGIAAQEKLLAGLLAQPGVTKAAQQLASSVIAQLTAATSGGGKGGKHGAHAGHHHPTHDRGGWLLPGTTVAVNGTGRPEAVLTPAESQAFVGIVRHLASGAGLGGPGVQVTQHVTATPTMDTRQVANAAASRLVGALSAMGVSL